MLLNVILYQLTYDCLVASLFFEFGATEEDDIDIIPTLMYGCGQMINFYIIATLVFNTLLPDAYDHSLIHEICACMHA